MLGKNENECEYAFLPSNVSQKSYYSVYSETLYGPIILTKSLINCFVDSNFIRKSEFYIKYFRYKLDDHNLIL